MHVCHFILVYFQLVAKDHPFVVWMDASVRYTTTDLRPLFDQSKQLGVMAIDGGGNVAMRGHENMFELLREPPCAFRNVPEIQATFIIIYGNMFIEKYFLKPWISCALTIGCMLPDIVPLNYLLCGKHGAVYHDCHRYDQSMLDILMYRLFFKEIQKHKARGRLRICRDCIT